MRKSKAQVVQDLFLHDKPAKLLIKVKEGKGEKYASVLAKEVDCTYSHCIRILKDLEKMGFVVFDKKGRTKKIKITKQGEDLAFALENVVRIIERLE